MRNVAMNGGGTKLVFPGLAGFYASMQPVAYTLMRVVLGIIIFVHGWGKVAGMGAGGVTGFFTKVGLPAPGLLAYCAIFLETVGAACIVVGLFTRFFASALAIEMLIGLLTVHLAKGFGVGQGGYEYILLIGIVLFAIAIRGGGPYSIDAKIGKEL
jgi:putative oxidoreductase